MRSWLLVIFGMVISILIVAGVIYSQKVPGAASLTSTLSSFTSSSTPSMTSPSPEVSPAPSPSSLLSPSPNLSPSPLSTISPSPLPSPVLPDLTVDSNGLSKATVSIQTAAGSIKFKFYPNDAPKSVRRVIELIQSGFYNGLLFHRVIPGFIVQGGDPTSTGDGGSGQKLEPEFNERRHIEGTVAMARAGAPNSADSQFYITLGTFPHLDRQYTVIGQVIEGMDVVKRIKAGDKMMSVTVH